MSLFGDLLLGFFIAGALDDKKKDPFKPINDSNHSNSFIISYGRENPLF